MKVDVRKYYAHAPTGWFDDHSDHIRKMYKKIGCLPTHTKGRHEWFRECGEYRSRKWCVIGFDDSTGKIFCECHGRNYKDPTKNNLHEDDATAMAQELLRIIQIFDEFGILVSEEEVEDEVGINQH